MRTVYKSGGERRDSVKSMEGLHSDFSQFLKTDPYKTWMSRRLTAGDLKLGSIDCPVNLQEYRDKVNLIILNNERLMIFSVECYTFTPTTQKGVSKKNEKMLRH